MEEELDRIMEEIQIYKRLDPLQENINTNFIIHMLEQQYNVIYNSIKKEDVVCDCCSKKLESEKEIFEYGSSIFCEECLDIKTNGPEEEDNDMEELVEDLLNNFNSN